MMQSYAAFLLLSCDLGHLEIVKYIYKRCGEPVMETLSGSMEEKPIHSSTKQQLHGLEVSLSHCHKSHDEVHSTVVSASSIMTTSSIMVEKEGSCTYAT
jgi:hypothetical protein